MLVQKAFRYYRVNYDLFSQFDNGASYLKLKVLTIFFYFCRFSFSWLARIWVSRWVETKEIKNDGTIGFVFSYNQSLILKALRDNGLSLPAYDLSGYKTNNHNTASFSKFLLFIASIANSRLIVEELENSKKDVVIRNNYIRVVKLGGIAYLLEQVLGKAKAIVNFNDHSVYNVLLHDLAKSKDIRTVYIQHAPVSERFPPLYHDLNILFSQDSLSKYKVHNKDAKILQLFDLRFISKTSSKEMNNSLKRILVCPNELDDINKVKTLIKKLSLHYEVIIRPHPRDKRNWKVEAKNSYVSTNLSIWQDLKDVRIVLSNESAVTLEAIHDNKLFYKCAFFSSSFDNYGFIRQGLLLKEYNSTKEVMEAIEIGYVSYDKKKMSYFIGDLENIEEKIKKLNYEILRIGN